MFTNAVLSASAYTRPIKFITRNFPNQTVIPGSATMFFVNECGYAITCKHVADLIVDAEKVNQNYVSFKQELDLFPSYQLSSSKIRSLQKKYRLDTMPAQILVQFVDCFSSFKALHITTHPTQDLAILHFDGYENTLYSGYAVFADDANTARPGTMLCRLGFPFPEFSDYLYDPASDTIFWTDSKSPGTPQFPIEGMFTRHISDPDGKIVGIEVSTPGLRGQSGGPLFRADGLVFGMQAETAHMHLGFDMIKHKFVVEGKEITVNNQPFLHVGRCVHVDIIKEFLHQHHVPYYVGTSIDTARRID